MNETDTFINYNDATDNELYVWQDGLYTWHGIHTWHDFKLNWD